MKKLTIVTHVNVQQALGDQLRALEMVPGFTFARIEGHGVHSDKDAVLSMHDKVVGYVPRVKVDILLEDGDVDRVLNALGKAECGLAGKGIYWVTPAVQYGRL